MRAGAWRIGLAGAALAAALAWYVLRVPSLPPDAVAGAAPSLPDDVARGEYLLGIAGCATCHTDAESGGAYLAGGRRLDSPFGAFYTSNITPDAETGIGGWSLQDFVRSLGLGVRPDGQRHFPAYPYTSYSAMTPADMRALFAYLQTVPPVRSAPLAHELPWYVSRASVALWQALFFRPGPRPADPQQDEARQRGAYLVRAVGHCGECHTPRNALGAMDSARFLAGTPDGPDGEPVPNITSSREAGIGRWSRRELRIFLEEGLLPDGDFTGGAMTEVVDNNLAGMTDEDRAAMVDYLRSVPPQE